MPECRFCLQDDEIKSLINPCLCKGSAEFVHSECIEKWRGSDKESSQYNYCPVCKSKYNTSLVIILEDIPNYESSTIIRIFLHPFLIPAFFLLHYSLIFMQMPTARQSDLNMNIFNSRTFLLSQFFCMGMYFGVYINLFKAVENKHRYLKHSSEFMWVPITHGLILFSFNYTPLLSAIGNHWILPHYIYKHTEILNKMNRKI